MLRKEHGGTGKSLSNPIGEGQRFRVSLDPEIHRLDGGIIFHLMVCPRKSAKPVNRRVVDLMDPVSNLETISTCQIRAGDLESSGISPSLGLGGSSSPNPPRGFAKCRFGSRPAYG